MKKKFPLLIAFILLANSVFSETIQFSAGYMSGQTGKGESDTVLEENAYIKTDTMEIYADRVELSGEDFRYIKAIGNVDGKNLESKMDFSCDVLEYDRELEKAVLKGNVFFVDVENDVDAKAEVIEYDQKNEIAVFQINVNIKQKDNICTGSYCVYYKEKQMLEISGNAQVKQKDDTFRAQHISLNLETEEISLGGNVKGSVTDTKEKTVENKSNPVVEENTKTKENTTDAENKVESNSKTTTENNDTNSASETNATESKITENKSETKSENVDEHKNSNENNKSSGNAIIKDNRKKK